MRSHFAEHPEGFDLVAWQRRQTRSDRFTLQLGLIDEAGITVRSTAGGVAAMRIDVSDREHFRAHLDPDRDELFISRPVLGRGTRKWTLQFTRKLLRPDGSFAGVALVSLGCEEMSQFYDTLELGHGMVALIGTDGIIRARGPLREGALGADISERPFFARIRGAAQGDFRDAHGVDGTARLVSFRRLPDLPLVVLVGFDESQVFQAYRGARLRSLWIGGIATAIVLLLGALWIVLRRRCIASRRLLRLTLDSVGQGIVMVEAGGAVPVVNRRAMELLGLPPEALCRPGSAAAFPGAPAADSTVQITRADGKILEVQGHPTPRGGTVLTYTDITERKLAEARILHLAHHDPLTGLPNRILLNRRIAEAVEHGAQTGEHFAVLCLDLDGFKAVNDSLGHDIGDLVLIRFAERLRGLVRPIDTVARSGGDEFAILLRGIASPVAAEQVAQRMLAGQPLPLHSGGTVPALGSSLGIAVYPDDGTDARTLLKNADTALYRAKSLGKGGFCRFEAWMDRSLAERRLLEHDLRLAIERDELDVYFQPQFAADTLNVAGFEALVRWPHASRGFVPPGVFIPLAEENGMIVAIGRRVLERACALAANWRPRCRVAVNLSPVQFRDSLLLPLLSGVLLRTGLPAGLLELEVTEGVLIKDEEQALETLRGIKEIGVSIALDDFGTGYSSLSYLRRFPFDKIKIDKCFVHAQQQDAGTRTILEAVLAMSSRLKLRVTAEGVETEEQLALLREQGCDELQGFLLGRPMPNDEVQAFLRQATDSAGRDRRHLRVAATTPAPEPETRAA